MTGANGVLKVKCPKCGYEFEVGRYVITITKAGLWVKLVVDEKEAEE